MASPWLATMHRPYNTTLLIVFAVLAALGAWSMRIGPILNEVPVGFLSVIEDGVLPNGVPIKKHFTGLKVLDEGLSFLVTAFIYGPAGWNEPFYWQQIHFLGQISGLVAIMNVEACRERNQSSWLKYTAIFTFVYQNVGACIIAPIWCILLHRLSSEKPYFALGRAVPLPYASIILPATLFIYLVPTAAMFLPGTDTITLQNLIAFWQLTPVFVNIPLWFASPFVSSAVKPNQGKPRASDLPHLNLLYGTLFAINTAIHWYTIYGISVSENPAVTYASVWVPSTSTWKDDLAFGVLHLFQCDWVITGLLLLIVAFVAVCDVQRIIHGSVSGGQVITTGFLALVLTFLTGPSGLIMAVWYWRENKLALIEQRLDARDVKKGK